MAKVTNISLKPALLLLTGSVSREITEQVSDQVVEVARKSMEPIVQAHYTNVVKEVGRKLNGLGMAQNVQSAGARQLGFGTVNGGLGKIITKNWKELRKRYAGRTPNSLWFWQKTGMEANPNSLIVAYKRDVMGKEVAQVQAAPKAARNHHKGRINVRMILGFNALPQPFESAITQAFSGANEQVSLGPRSLYTGRKGLSRARWAEEDKAARSRPFIRRMSAALGKDMYKDLAKKLRNL